MTYARARLWLGITGVGSVVSLAFAALVFGLPNQTLAGAETGLGQQAWQLTSVCGLFMLWLLPFDFLGGYWLPRKFEKSKDQFAVWLRSYLVAAVLQATFFVIAGSLILLLSQKFGYFGGAVAICLGITACFFVRDLIFMNRKTVADRSTDKLGDAISMVQSWQIAVPPTIVVDHKDVGFTGGIIGVGNVSQILLPKAWMNFSRGQLATVIARRSLAINSGSYARGLLFAFVWNLGGFMLCSVIPGNGLATVATLISTVCAFTLWSFVGLLTLPTFSRNASLKIDQQLAEKGIPAELISQSAAQMDQLQDGEPDRSALIETIFHPVPNVSSRNRNEPVRGFSAWNVARTTLFFSWACFGFLSRSVHCNVGRPELWTLLPSD